MSKPRHLQPRKQKCTKPNVSAVIIPSPSKNIKKPTNGVRQNKNSWTNRENMMYLTEERLIFLVGNREDWEKWQKAFEALARIEVIRDIT